ncbi:unnamed protein product, partial [Mesorhabditis spiculigera]
MDPNEAKKRDTKASFGKDGILGEMEAKAILLANTFLILSISSVSEHWLLYKVRKQTPPPSHCFKHTSIQGVHYLQCLNRSYALIEQHTSLFRLCNDLTGSTRKNVSRRQLLVLTAPWSEWTPSAISYWEFGVSALFSLAALGNLVFAAHRAVKGNEKVAGRNASISCGLFTFTLLTQLHIMHSVNTQPPTNEAETLKYCEAGWSLLSGCLGTALSGVCGYLYLAAAQVRELRERSQKRRRLMHNAILSSCRQEIAVAIRAKMTVL